MGGAGAGHKSERARRSRRVNIQKARAARKRAPLPWRSGVESRIIEQLVWQWWVESSGEWLVASGEKKRQQVPHRHPAKTAGWVRDDNVKGSGQWLVGSGEKSKQQVPKGSGEWLGVSGQRQDRGKAASSSGYAGVREADRRTPYRDRPWAKYRVARLLGVSHTWVNKLVKRIEADPERMRRKMRAFAPATFEKLERAREETRRERERGSLRGPIRWRRVKVTLEGRKRTIVAVTQEEMKRRGALRQAQGQPYGLSDGQTARQMQRDSASRAGAASSAPTRAEENMCGQAAAVRYSELPTWAIGLPLPRGSGIAAGREAGMRMPGTALPSSGQAGRPRPVPFAFRRRR